MTTKTTMIPLMLLLCACDGGEEPAPEQPTAEYGCLHVAEGTIVDVSADRQAARTITAGRDPYRVNLLPNEPGFLKLELGSPTDLVVLLDQQGALPAVWRGDEREELGAGEPDPFCDEDIPEMHEISLPGGPSWLELGPVFQANVWMLVATP